jgi:hypothetical protein
VANATPPIINPGQKLDYTKRPFLGARPVNYLIALFNAINNLTVKVVSAVGNSATPAYQTASAPKFVWTAQGAILTIPIPPPSQATQGWFWTSGSRNYNPASTYQEQQLVYVQASSSAVTSGLPDAGTLTNKKSLAGIWVCLKATGPVTISGSTYYNVPRLPMPVVDDMDSSSNYWAFVSQNPLCI